MTRKELIAKVDKVKLDVTRLPDSELKVQIEVGLEAISDALEPEEPLVPEGPKE